MQYISLIVKKFIVIVLCICILFSVSTGAFADEFGGGGFGSTSYSTVSIYDYIQGFLNRSAVLGDDLIEDVSAWWSDITDVDYYNSSVDSLANTFGGRYSISSSDTSRSLICNSISNSYTKYNGGSYSASINGWYIDFVIDSVGFSSTVTSSTAGYIKSSFYSAPFTVNEDGYYYFYFPKFIETHSAINTSYYPYYYLQYYVNGSWTTMTSRYSSGTSAAYSLNDNGLYSYSYPAVSASSIALSKGVSYRLYVTSTCYLPASNAGAFANYDINFGFVSSPYFKCTSTSSVYIDSSTRLASVNYYSSYYNTYINNNYTAGDTIYNYYIGTLNSNDQVNNVYDPDIYDEETLIFTEPVTGDQIQTSGWKYLYTSAARSYYLTLSDGTYYYQASDDDDVQEITNIMLAYLDDCLYICGFTHDIGEYSTASEALADAAFIDQYYYVIAETETTDSDTNEDSCEHVFTTSTIVEPTCTDSGVRRYTCDICGFTQDVTISALGHSYEVTETVETEYDGDDVTKVGYTLYTCSTCGATNKVYDTAVYPDYSGSGGSGGSSSSDDDDDDDSSSSFWTTIKNAIAEALGTLITSLVSLVAAFMSGISSALEYLLENIVGTIVDFIVQIIEWLFNLIDFDYLTSWFSWFDDNEVFDEEFGTSGDSYDVWNYS